MNYKNWVIWICIFILLSAANIYFDIPGPPLWYNAAGLVVNLFCLGFFSGLTAAEHEDEKLKEKKEENKKDEWDELLSRSEQPKLRMFK